MEWQLCWTIRNDCYWKLQMAKLPLASAAVPVFLSAFAHRMKYCGRQGQVGHDDFPFQVLAETWAEAGDAPGTTRSMSVFSGKIGHSSCWPSVASGKFSTP